MSQTRNQQHHSTTWEVLTDWHEPIVPQRIMWPSTARAKTIGPTVLLADTPSLQSATLGLHPVFHNS